LPSAPYAGLGFSSEKPDWHGGKVIFRGILREIDSSDNQPAYSVFLLPPELGSSCRFARRFGSSAILRIKVSSVLLLKKNNRVVEYFLHPFILSGRVFRAFFAKDNTVFLVQTNETVDGLKISSSMKLDGRLSLPEFLQWHNPFEVNQNQVCPIFKVLDGYSLWHRVWQSGRPGLHSDFQLPYLDYAFQPTTSSMKMISVCPS
jgi:RNA-dependent RNA polymerase